MSDSYYSERLAADRLRRCYELATPAVQRFLHVESESVRERIRPGDRVLELGCGYGRVLRDLGVPESGSLTGIDISLTSLLLAREELADLGPVFLAQMDGPRLGFRDGAFDLVCCIQNGISAFHTDQHALLAEAVRVTRPGGLVLFSSYAAEFWDERLNWFRIQAAHGLVGEIDETATGDGVIVCRDGFTATTVGPERFRELAAGLGRRTEVRTVARCSVFCEITV